MHLLLILAYGRFNNETDTKTFNKYNKIKSESQEKITTHTIHKLFAI